MQCGSTKDVDKAVKAAKKAFETGEWSKISARERGQYLYKYDFDIITLQCALIFAAFLGWPN